MHLKNLQNMSNFTNKLINLKNVDHDLVTFLINQ